jgi:hypothetical protein
LSFEGCNREDAIWVTKKRLKENYPHPEDKDLNRGRKCNKILVANLTKRKLGIRVM